MFKIEIDSDIATKILSIYLDENKGYYYIITKINDIDLKISKYYSIIADFDSDEDEILINLNTILSNKIDDSWSVDSFQKGELIVFDFDSEEEALYFQLKYGGTTHA